MTGNSGESSSPTSSGNTEHKIEVITGTGCMQMDSMLTGEQYMTSTKKEYLPHHTLR